MVLYAPQGRLKEAEKAEPLSATTDALQAPQGRLKGAEKAELLSAATDAIQALIPTLLRCREGAGG